MNSKAAKVDNHLTIGSSFPFPQLSVHFQGNDTQA